jgi:hypothetical protein
MWFHTAIDGMPSLVYTPFTAQLTFMDRSDQYRAEHDIPGRLTPLGLQPTSLAAGVAAWQLLARQFRYKPRQRGPLARLQAHHAHLCLRTQYDIS